MPVKINYPIINREISWLSFNDRVLQEAADERLPLIERFRFLGIYSNNLDEFFRVRVATMRRLIELKKDDPGALDFDPEKVVNEINEINLRQQKQFRAIHIELLQKLEQEQIYLVNEKQLLDEQQVFVRDFFREHVRPNIFPVMLKNIKRPSFLRDKSIYLAIQLIKNNDKEGSGNALIKVPGSVLPRFVVLPDNNGKKYIIMLDDVIRFNLAEVFSIFDYDDFKAYTIKITRDAELDIDNDVSKSFIERLSDSLKKRKKGKPVRFVYDQEMPPEMFKLLISQLKVSGKDNIVAGGRYHNSKDYMAFPNLGGPHLVYDPMPPLPHPDLAGSKSIIDVLRKKDVMLHFPYQSFHYIIDLLREASIDPKVKSIKMTIYRAARSSKVINALVNAARNGKNVTVFLELQARFDEQANIFWSEKMQEEGVKIIQGIDGLKVHCKLMLIKRKEGSQLVSYANIGTGNFNEETARIYADDSLLTSNPSINQEVEKVFKLFERTYVSAMNFRQLVVSPYRTRSFFLRLIDNEIRNARAGLRAELLIKLNSLVDTEIVHKLYKASKAGVKCRLIVRGICTLIPGIPDLSENIEAISIVDRYLEHSRVFIFYNGGNERFFISSADFMARNLDHRIEVGCPIFDRNIQDELRTMMEIQWQDNVKARILEKKRKNSYRLASAGNQVRSQLAIYEYFKNT